MVRQGREPSSSNPRKPLCSAALAASRSSSNHTPDRGSDRDFLSSIMRRSLTSTLFGLFVLAPGVSGQVLDHTLVPFGHVRVQVSPVFESWDSRFGGTPDGGESVERLGADLTSLSAVTLFPGIASLTEAVRALGDADFAPVLGSAAGFVRQDVTRVEFGAHIGVLDWLTIGAVVPWTQTRTTMDVFFTPDSTNANVGLNPAVTEPGAVESFLTSAASASAQAAASAADACSAGASAECTTAQDLADRAASLDASFRGAYAASTFFPLTGTVVADAIMQSATTLDADLAAAGLPGLGSPVMAGGLIGEGDFATIPSLAGGGIETSPLQPRESLWSVGDIEVSARIRLLDNLTPSGPDDPPPHIGYRVSGRLLARLPTGTQPDPVFLLDLGTGQAQTDLQGGLTAELAIGRHLGLVGGGYYGTQASTTLTTRVAPPEQVLAPLSTQTDVTWDPGSYFGVGIAPIIKLAPSVTLSGEYRYFHKGRDRFTLVDPSLPLDPTVLSLESGVDRHMVGGGIRYDTVDPWRRGEASHPMEIHVRLLSAIEGGGGQTPKTTRIEAGIRLFKRFWGPSR